MTSEETIRDFIAAWARLDPEELAGSFCEYGTYHNIPTRPVKGRKNVEEMIRRFIATWTETDWEILPRMSVNPEMPRADKVEIGPAEMQLTRMFRPPSS